MTTLYGANVVTDGLVLNLDAANVKSYPGSGTVWTDISTYKEPGTITGATFNSDFGGSIRHDGSSDYVRFGNLSHLMVTTTWTFEWYCKRNSITNREETVIGKNGESTPWVGYEVMFDDTNKIGLWTSGPAGNGWNYFNTTMTDTNWHHYAISFSGSASTTGTAILYLDGVQVETMTNKRTPGSPSLRIFELGNIRGSRNFTGDLSLVRIYNQQLTSDQIAQNFNATRGRYSI